MELVGEDGSVLELKEGHPIVLGRVCGLSHHDGSVSRHQVVVEPQRPSSRKGKELAGEAHGIKLQVQVVGRNPICIVSREREDKCSPQVRFWCNGQKFWLISGDKISFSIKRPFFYEFRIEGRSSPNSGKAAVDTKVNFNSADSAPCKRNGEYANFATMDEEEGIAKAVARRQRRKLAGEEVTGSSTYNEQHVGTRERIRDDTENEEKKVASRKERNVPRAVTKRVENCDQTMNEQAGEVHVQQNRDIHSVDPVTDFGFIVEGSEFSAFEKQTKSNQSLWRSEIGESKGVEDDSCGNERVTPGRGGNEDKTVGRKSHSSDEEEEWGGDNKAEQDRLKIVAQKNGQRRMSTSRSRPKSKTSKSETNEGGSIKPQKKIQEYSSEDEDDSTGSLDDFIVDDEDPIEEDENDIGAPRKGGGTAARQSQKPECKYGSKCYRKNAEHRAQFYHPSS